MNLVNAVKNALNDDNILCWSTDINPKVRLFSNILYIFMYYKV